MQPFLMKDYTVQSTYTFLEVSLKEFDESLTAAVITAKSSTATSVGRWRWASNIQLYIHQFIHLMQTPSPIRLLIKRSGYHILVL